MMPKFVFPAQRAHYRISKGLACMCQLHSFKSTGSQLYIIQHPDLTPLVSEAITFAHSTTDTISSSVLWSPFNFCYLQIYPPKSHQAICQTYKLYCITPLLKTMVDHLQDEVRFL